MSESIYGSYLPELERVMRELQESIDKCTVKAPTDGIITALSVAEGSVPTAEAIMTIEDVKVIIHGDDIKGEFSDERLKINNAGHHVRLDFFLDLTVLKEKRHGFIGVVVPHHFVDHGKMSGNVVPQAVVGLLIDVHKFLDPEHIV